MRSAMISLAVLLCLSSAAALAAERELPDDVTVMTEAELRSAIIGNTVTGFVGGTPWSEYYLPNGVIQGVEGGERYVGRWTISGPWLCFDYDGTEDDGCSTLARSGNNVRFYDEDGDSGDYSTAEILQGNAQGL